MLISSGKTVVSIALLAVILGKTCTSADQDANAERRRRAKDKKESRANVKPILVIAPASVRASWIEHLELWGFFDAKQ